MDPHLYNTPEWAVFSHAMQQRIDELRAQNDQDLDPIATAKKRGAIAELKSWLAPAANRDQGKPFTRARDHTAVSY